MILEYLAAGGGAYEQFTLTVGRELDGTYGEYYHGYSQVSSFGSITPASFRGKTFRELTTIDLSGGTFAFVLNSANDGKYFWTRMEFVRNGQIEKTIFVDQTSYLNNVGGETREQWTATGTGFDLTYLATYTVRIYY